MDDARLGDLLTGAARSLRRRWGAVLEPMGLSPHQARALRVLAGAEGTRVSDLAAALRIVPRSATEVVDALAEHGLVERATDPHDRRAVVVHLTEAGRTTQAQVEAARATDAEALFARLSVAERAELARLLRQLAD